MSYGRQITQMEPTTVDRNAPMDARRLAAGRVTRIGLAALVALTGAFSVPAPSRAADPPEIAAARELARVRGGSAADYTLVHAAGAPSAEAGIAWSGKFVDARTGEVVAAHLRADGTVGEGSAPLRQTPTVADTFAAKADDALVAAVAAADAGRTVAGVGTDTVPVAVWLDVDVASGEEAVRAAHPEISWIAGRPASGTLDQIRAVRGELWTARRDLYVAAAEALRAGVEAGGGEIGYISTSAPLVYVDLPPASVPDLATRPDVASLGLEGQWEEQMSSAGRAVRADWTSSSTDQGNGVRVAVVEYHNVHNTGDMAGQVVRSYSASGTLAYRSGGGDHPTWVAGAVASRSGTYRGTAPGADIVSASTGGYTPSVSTDRRIIAAADWAIAPTGGDADVVNASIGQDTATGAEEGRRYFDSVSWEDGRLVVAASGNFVTFGNWDVVSPGTGYNVLTVGGINDRNTASWADDRVWYQPGSNGASYRDSSIASWNPHGDFNKPNLSAPAVSVRTANGIYGDGTSVASPIVAGLAAQLIARHPVLAAWPEGTRAILMAGALRHTPMPDGSINVDHEGVGTADARWSNRILDGGTFGGYRIGSTTGATVAHEISVVRGQRVRVALAWSSHTSGTVNTAKTDTLTADLDLRVVGPSGTVRWGATFDNAYETVDIVAAATGTMRLEIRPTRFDAAEEPYGLAWATSGPFFDADDSAFRNDIMWAWNAGITSGCGSGRYCPGSTVNREQMASFLVRAMEPPATSRDFFADDERSAHEGDINRLAATGVTAGCASRRYCPTLGVTREQMASFLVRALRLPRTSRDFFTDDERSAHEADINALAAAGITGGCSATRYCPTAPVSREQMAAFLRRGFDR
jgi:hypothetical protein